MTWNTLQDTVESLNEQNIELDETVVAGEIHDLLDNVPWESEGTYLILIFSIIVAMLLKGYCHCIHIRNVYKLKNGCKLIFCAKA